LTILYENKKIGAKLLGANYNLHERVEGQAIGVEEAIWSYRVKCVFGDTKTGDIHTTNRQKDTQG
jgi:hypothetical protein